MKYPVVGILMSLIFPTLARMNNSISIKQDFMVRSIIIVTISSWDYHHTTLMYFLQQVTALNEPTVTKRPVDLTVRHRQLRGYTIDDDDSNDTKNVDDDCNDDKKHSEGKTKHDDIFNNQDSSSSDGDFDRVSIV
jgi:hypothetical protein